jgi:hypothetical protein
MHPMGEPYQRGSNRRAGAKHLTGNWIDKHLRITAAPNLWATALALLARTSSGISPAPCLTSFAATPALRFKLHNGGLARF